MNLDCPFLYLGFPGGSEVKNPPANVGDTGDSSSIPGLGISPGRGNGNLLQYSCLGNPMDRETWCAPIHGAAKESDMTEPTHSHPPTHTHTHTHTQHRELYSVFCGDLNAKEIQERGDICIHIAE